MSYVRYVCCQISESTTETDFYMSSDKDVFLDIPLPIASCENVTGSDKSSIANIPPPLLNCAIPIVQDILLHITKMIYGLLGT